MYNPIKIVGGGRRHANQRRHRVGAEFKYCPDGSQVAFDVDCPTPPGRGDIIDIIKKPGGGGWGGGGWTDKPSGGGGGYTPSGGGGGTPYTPPGGGGGGTPYTPPGGGGGGTPYTPPGGGGGTPGGGNTPTSGGGPTIPNGCQPLIQTCPENQKRYIMPFIPDTGYTASVTAGSQVRFVGKPQKMFKPDRLIIASSIAPYFDVVNLLIANIPQSLSQGNVAADIYSEVSTYTLMSFDQAYPGIDIIIIAQNKSSVTQTFQAQLIGEAIG